MSTDLKLEIHSTSSEQTEELGRAIGARLRGGEVLQLVSDLGGGKTTLTKGIVKGAGCEEVVSSPTFTISKEYIAPAFTFHHYDFYRLQDAGVVGMELQEDFTDQKVVTIIEWADIVQDVLPKDVITIKLQYDSEDTRIITINAPKNRTYTVEDLR